MHINSWVRTWFSFSDSLSPTSSPDQAGPIAKATRPTFSRYQVMQLKLVFSRHKYLKPDQRKQLAVQLDMTDKQVKGWFQNRRTKLKRKLVEAEARDAKVTYLNSLANKIIRSPAVLQQPSYPQPTWCLDEVPPAYRAGPGNADPSSYLNGFPDEPHHSTATLFPSFPSTATQHAYLYWLATNI